MTLGYQYRFNQLAAIAAQQTANPVVTPGVAALGTAGFAPQLRLTVPVGVAALVITRYAPAVNDTGTTIVPAPRALTTARFAPVLKLVVTPAAQALVATRLAPVTGYGFVPGTRALATTRFAPTVIVGGRFTPVTAALYAVTYRPLAGWALSIPLIATGTPLGPATVGAGPVVVPVIRTGLPIVPAVTQIFAAQTPGADVAVFLQIRIDDNGAAGPAEWVDLSAYVNDNGSLDWARGLAEDRAPATGTMRFVLNNQSGIFTGGNRDSRFFNKLVPGRPFRHGTTYNGTTRYWFTGELTDIRYPYSPDPAENRVEIDCESVTANLRKRPGYGTVSTPTLAQAFALILDLCDVTSSIEASPNIPALAWFWITHDPRADLAALAANAFGGRVWERGDGAVMFTAMESFLGGYDEPDHDWGGVVAPEGDIVPDSRWDQRFSRVTSRVNRWQGTQTGYIGEVGSTRSDQGDLFIEPGFRRPLQGEFAGPPLSVDTTFRVDRTMRAGIGKAIQGGTIEDDLERTPESFILDCTHVGDGRPRAGGYLATDLPIEPTSVFDIEDPEGFEIANGGFIPGGSFLYYRIGGDNRIHPDTGQVDPDDYGETVRILSRFDTGEGYAYTVLRGMMGDPIREWPAGTYVREGFRPETIHAAALNDDGDELLGDGLRWSVVLENTGSFVETVTPGDTLSVTVPPVSAANLARDPETSSGTAAWEDPGAVINNDGAVATAVLGGGTGEVPAQSNYLKTLYGIGFDNIPDSATILGVEVRVRASWQGSGFPYSPQFPRVPVGVSLVIADAVNVAATRTLTMGGERDIDKWVTHLPEREYVFGGPADLWGQSLTPVTLKSGNFGAAFFAGVISSKGGGGTLSVDQIQVGVYYSENDVVAVTAIAQVRACLYALYIAGSYLIYQTEAGPTYTKRLRYIQELRDGPAIEIPFSQRSAVTDGYVYSALRIGRTPSAWVPVEFALASEEVAADILAAEINDLVLLHDASGQLRDWYRIETIAASFQPGRDLPRFRFLLSPAHEHRDPQRLIHNTGYASTVWGLSPTTTEFGDDWVMAGSASLWVVRNGGVALKPDPAIATSDPVRVADLNRGLSWYGSGGWDGVVEATILNPREGSVGGAYRSFRTPGGGVGVRFRVSADRTQWWAAYFSPAYGLVVLANAFAGEVATYPWTPPTSPTQECEIGVRYQDDRIRVYVDQLPEPVIDYTSTAYIENTWIGKYARFLSGTYERADDVIWLDFYGQAL